MCEIFNCGNNLVIRGCCGESVLSGEKFDGFAMANCAGFDDKDGVVAIMLKGGADVPALLTVAGPHGHTLGFRLVNDGPGDEWDHGCGIVVEDAKDLGVG